MKTKRCYYTCLLIFFLIRFAVFAQPTIQWERSYGGTKYEDVSVIQPTPDGGGIMGCLARSNDGDVLMHYGSTYQNDIWIVKTNASGAIQWQKTLGGTGREWINSIMLLKDGSYLVTGSTLSDNFDASTNNGPMNTVDYWLIKLDSFGNIIWSNCYGGSKDDILTCSSITVNGEYILGGYSLSNDGDVTGHHGTTSKHDYWVVKTDSLGNLIWQKSLGGSEDDHLYSIAVTSDGGCYIGGHSASSDGDVIGHHGSASTTDAWVLKLDANGNVEWQRSLGGSLEEHYTYVLTSIDNGCVMRVASYSNDGDVIGHHGAPNVADYWIVKLDSIGIMQWQKSLGGSSSEFYFNAYFRSTSNMINSKDGGYIVTMNSASNDGDVTGHHGPTNTKSDYWIVKLDPMGTIQWQKSVGGSEDERVENLIEDMNGYIIAGSSESNNGDVTGHHGPTNGYDYNDFWIVKLDTNGKLLWQKSLGGSYRELLSSASFASDGGILLVGTANSTDGDVKNNHSYGADDCWIVKLNSPTVIEDNSITNNIAIYPNPTNGLFNVKFNEVSKNRIVEVYNSLGEKLLSHQANEIQIKIDLKNYQNGIYFIKVIENNEQVYTQKIIKQ